MQWPRLAYVITILAALALLLASCETQPATGGSMAVTLASISDPNTAFASTNNPCYLGPFDAGSGGDLQVGDTLIFAVLSTNGINIAAVDFPPGLTRIAAEADLSGGRTLYLYTKVVTASDSLTGYWTFRTSDGTGSLQCYAAYARAAGGVAVTTTDNVTTGTAHTLGAFNQTAGDVLLAVYDSETVSPGTPTGMTRLWGGSHYGFYYQQPSSDGTFTVDYTSGSSGAVRFTALHLREKTSVTALLYTAGPDGKIAQLDATSGAINWTKTIFGSGDQGLRVATGADGRVAFGTDTGNVGVLDSSGNVIWTQTAIMGAAQAIGVVVMSDNSVLALPGSGSSPDAATARLLDATDGHQLDSWLSPDGSNFGAIGMDPTGAFVIVGDSLGAVYRLNITAGSISQAWAITLPGYDWVTDIRITADGAFVLGYDGQHVYKIDPATGSITWTYDHNASTGSSTLLSRMVVLSDGIIRIAQADGAWYSVNPDGSAGTSFGTLISGYANTPAGAGHYGEFDGIYGATIDANDTMYWAAEPDDSGTPAGAVRSLSNGAIDWTTIAFPPGNTVVSGTYPDAPHGLAIVSPTAPTTSLPALDSPVRVDLSEDLTGRFSDVGIQLDYLPNHDIAKNIGEQITIGDQITPTDPLYTFWIKTKSWRGGLVNYSGETVLGRLDDLEPPTLAQTGPFTARQALTKMLDHFQSAAGGWLTYAALPELLVPTAVGPYAPTIKALVLKQADPNDPTAKRTAALEWLQQYLGLFEGYVLRANQAGELQIVPPAWARAGNSAYFGTYDTPTPITSAAGYTQSWPWSGTQAQLDLQLVGDGDRYSVTYHAETVTAGTPHTFHMTLTGDAYAITWEITGGELKLTITPDDPGVTKDYNLSGVATNPTPSSGVAKTIPTAAIKMGESSELDVDYVANICEVNSQGQDYVAGFEAWSPAYLDYNPKPIYPAGMGGYTGTAVQWTDSATRTTWLPDPGTGYGREKIDTAWKLADPATIIEAGTPITLTLGFDAYWSAQPTDYIGNCIPTIQQIPPEAYPGTVAFEITDADGVTTTEGGGLPHTLADITLPADGREITVHMYSIRAYVSYGKAEQILKISFDSTTGEIRIRTVKSVLAQAGGGRGLCAPSPWFLAPRWTLNATATAFTTAAESVTGIWGETDQLGELAGLAESQTTYGKRKLTLDAGPFHLDQATCLAIAEATVRARYQPVRVYTFDQARAYPLRPDDGNSLVQIGTTSIRGTVIARDYQEAHTPQSSASSAPFKIRAVETLPELAQALAEDRLDIAALDQGVFTE